MNDLPYCLHYSKTRMLADDTNITTCETLDELKFLINKDLDFINSRLLANKLTPNLTKTEFIITGPNNRIKNIIEPVDIKLGTVTIHCPK